MGAPSTVSSPTGAKTAAAVEPPARDGRSRRTVWIAVGLSAALTALTVLIVGVFADGNRDAGEASANNAGTACVRQSGADTSLGGTQHHKRQIARNSPVPLSPVAQ